ncbi:MAG: hypothetical protein ACFFCD_07025 [Promethearchaeota archaeon]
MADSMNSENRHRYETLESKMRIWPLTLTNDPYKFAAEELAK